MSRFRKNVGRRILAYLLSGAMIMSNMTAFASEPSNDTGGGYIEEAAVEIEAVSTDDVEETEVEETSKNEDNNSDEKESSDEAVKETEVNNSEQVTETSENEQTSETESFLSTEEQLAEEETFVDEEDNKADNPDEDGFYDGFEANTAASGTSYYFDFTKIKNAEGTQLVTNDKLDNNYSKGLFKFNAGSKNQAVYHSTGNGVAFKYDNRLTFSVAGDSYIVIGGNNNSKCTNLEASCTTGGTVSPETQTSTTSGQATLAACKTRGANTIVYTYVGTGGDVTLKLNTEGDAPVYLAYACIIPRKEVKTEWKFKEYPAATDAAITEWNGLEISNGKKHSVGLAASTGTITVPIKDPTKDGKIIVKACHTYAFTIGDGKKIQGATGSTNNIDTFEYYYKAGTTEVVINVSGTNYIDSIKVDTDNLTITNETNWDFTSGTAIDDYEGLIISGGSLHQGSSGQLLMIKSGSIMIPVKETCKVTVYLNNSWDLAFYDYSGDNIKTKDNSSTTIEYNYDGGKGMVPIIVGQNATTYIEKITVTYSTDTKVSGQVEKPAELENLTLVFSREPEGVKTEVAVKSDGTYTTELKAGYAYTVSLKNAPGYDIVNVQDKAFSIPADMKEKVINLLICESETNTEIKHYTLEADQYSKQAANASNKGQPLTGQPDDFFTIYRNESFSIDGTTEREFTPNDNTYAQTYKGTNRLNFSGNTAEARLGEIEFTITGHSVLWVYWMSSDSLPYLAIRDASGKIVTGEDNALCAEKAENTAQTNISSFTITEGGTYYISSATGNSENSPRGNGNYIYKALIATPVEVEPDYVEAKEHKFGSINDSQLESYYKGFEFDKDRITTGNSHGILTKNDNSTTEISINLKNKADITVKTCCYNAGTAATMEAYIGTEKLKAESEEILEESNKNGLQFVIEDAAAYSDNKKPLKLIFSGNTYIHSIEVTYKKEPVYRDAIDVWDFGGSSMTNTADFKYQNNITPDELKKWVKSENTKGNFTGTAPAKFGDLSMYFNSSDRLYTNVEALKDYSYGDYEAAQNSYSDYTAEGAWYCNGQGSATSRYITIDNVQAGDKIVAYMGSTQSGKIEFVFEGLGAASSQKTSKTVASGEYEKCEFVAEKSGNYKIYQKNSDGGKPMYHRIMRIPGVAVSGSIDTTTNNCTLPDGYTVKFINQTTDAETEAKVGSNGSYTVTLAPGYEYLAVLSGASGFGFTDTSKIVKTEDKEYLNGKTGVKLVVETKEMCTYSGSITGFDTNYQKLKDIKITLVPSGNSDKVKLGIEDDLTFSSTLLKGEKYTIELSGVDDYEVISSTAVNADTDVTDAEIKVKTKTKYSVTGDFIGEDLEKLSDINVTELKFVIIGSNNSEDNNYIYDAEVADNGYSVELRDGAYIAKATVDGYKMNTHVVVEGKAVKKDLMFVSTAAKEKIAWVSDVYVGYKDGRANNYETVNKAMEACQLMDYTPSEDKRIMVHIAPGTYREQIIVTTPYMTFVNDSDDEVLLTWYYGIGYKYYSSNGLYDPEKAYDKYEKKIADKWGVAVYVQKSATAFRAEGITFENSFNRYVTEEEIADGVEVSGTEKIAVVRELDTDVQSNAATERATALMVEADQAEFKNCGFYSSQDTLYIGEGKTHVYFKDCVIEGQTDYIFGGSDCVFDSCELRWKGFSSNSKAGYITAVRSAAGKADKGYLLKDCVITGNEKLTVVPGYFGRPWDADAKVVFMDTKLAKSDLIEAVGWSEMDGRKPENANFREYHTTFAGTQVDTSKRTAGTVMAVADAENVNVTDYFGNWTPLYYEASSGDDGKEKVVIVGAEPEPGSEAVPAETKITLTTNPEDAVIYYTLDGLDPVFSKDKKTYNKEEGIILKNSDADAGRKITIIAYAVKEGYKESDRKTFVYTLIKEDSGEPEVTEKVLVFDDLTDFTITTATAESEVKITDDFSVICHSNTKTGSSALTWEEAGGTGTTLSKYLSMGGAVKTNQAAIKFTTDGARKVTVYWAPTANGNGPVKILTDSGAEAAASTESDTVKDAPYCSTLELSDAGTYCLGSAKNGIKIYKIVVGALGGENPNPPGDDPTDPNKPTEDATKTLWLVGDSTVCSFDGTDTAYYYPRYGYGTQIENYETGYYTVKNLALSGRSSKSFLSEANYKTLKDGISEGDVLIIGFGHNDEKAKDDLYTNPNGDYQTEGSFAKSLYDNYVKIAIDKGATPILCTPIVRRNASGTLTDSNCHIIKDVDGYQGGDYAKAIRDLGTAMDVPVVDLTALTKELYTSIGAAGTLKLHAWTSNKPESVDDTHLNIYGAKKVAYMLAKEIQAKNIEGVSSHFWTEVEPTEAKYLKPNPDYKEIEYTAPKEDEKSALGDNCGIFKATAFGDLGGKPSSTNFTLGKDADGNMHIKVDGKGKIAADTDGIAMYYYPIPAGKTFVLSAKANINTIDVNSQVAFGLMARDDMYIDKNDKSIKSDYVAAGTFGDSSANCFYRKSGKLNKSSGFDGKVEAGQTYALSITYNGDGYSCKIGDNPEQSGGYDFQLTSIDSQYVYIGMFVARKADVTFTDIKLTVDGVEIDTGSSVTPGPGDDDPDPDKPTTAVDISDSTVVTVRVPNVISNGKAGRQDSEPVLTWNHKEDGKDVDRKLIRDYHYTVEDKTEFNYAKTDAAEDVVHTYVIKGIEANGFTGQVECTYTIYAKNSKNVTAASKLKVKLTTNTFNYTGAAITPADITVSDGNVILEPGEDKDYEIVYKNNYNAGKGTVIIIGTGVQNTTTGKSYIGSKEVDFNINKVNIKNLSLTYDDKEYSYYGSAVTVSNLRVELPNDDDDNDNTVYTLKEGRDYTVAYKANDKPGTASFTIKAMGDNFTGSIAKQTFTIGELKLEDIPEDALKEIEYSPKGAKLSTISFGEAVLTEGKDYTVKYKYQDKTKKVGSIVTATIIGKNVDKGNKRENVTLTIVPAHFSRLNVASESDLMIDTKNWSKRDKQIKVTDYAKATLKIGKDYTLEWLNKDGEPADGELGTGQQLIIKPIPKELADGESQPYTGEKTVTYRVAQKLNAKNYKVNDKYFNGRNPVTLTADDINGLTEGDKGLEAGDFRIISYKNNAKAGKAGKPVKATVTIEGTGKYYGKITLKFDVYN